MASTSTKVGHFLAKILGIKLGERDHDIQEELSRGESVFSVQTANTYVEEPPTVQEFLKEYTPTRKATLAYLKSLFPFVYWIHHYNLQWFLGDLVAGKVPSPSLAPNLS